MFPERPKKPKTDADRLKEAMATVEKAEIAANHSSRTCSQMQASYLKQAEELLEYKQRLLAHQVERDKRVASLKQAKDEMAAIQAKQAAAQGPFIAVGNPSEIVASYNPGEGVASGMAAIEGFGEVSHELAAKLQQGMQDLFKQHLGYFAKQLLVTPAADASAALAASPPVPAIAPISQQSAYNQSGADGCSDLSDPTLRLQFGSIDANMSTIGAKRGLADLSVDEDFGDDGLFDNGLGGNFDDPQGGWSQAVSQGVVPKDDAKTIADAEAAASIAVVNTPAVAGTPSAPSAGGQCS